MGDEVCHIRGLSLGLVGVLKGCRSGESAGRAWGSLRWGRGLAFGGAVTVENETVTRLEETWGFFCEGLEFY